MIRRGIPGAGSCFARGELRADFDQEVFFDQLYGALYFRLLVSGQPLNRGLTDELVDQAFQGISTLRRPR